MEPKTIFDTLRARHGDAVIDFHPAEGGVRDAFCTVRPGELHAVLESLRNGPGLAFDFLECLTGIDWPEKQSIEVVYHLWSYAERHRMVVKASLPRDKPVVSTVMDLWKAAEWQEREAFDLLGVHFSGHPDLRRVMMPDDWVGHPLRKDYTEPSDYHGIPTTRANPLELLKNAPKVEDKKAAP